MPIFPPFPSSMMTNRLRPEGGRSAEEICHGDHAADAEGDRRLARREHRIVVRPDRRFLQAAPARSEGDRRRRRRAGDQGSRSGADRAAHARGDRATPRPITDSRLHMSDPKVRLPEPKKKKGPRYTPVSRRQDRPNAILWLVRNHPELKDAQIMRLVGTTKSTIAGHPRAHALERRAAAAARPGDARPVHADRSRLRGAARREGEAGAAPIAGATLLPAAVTTAAAEAKPRPSRPQEARRRAQRRCGVRQAQAARQQAATTRGE